MTAQSRLDHLLAPAGIPQDTLITVGHITDAVGMDAARLVAGTVQAGASQDPLLAAAMHALYTTGMLLSPPDRQDMIDQLALAGEWSDEVRDAIKSLGIDNRPRWQVEGRAEEPTIESVQAEIDAEELAQYAIELVQRVSAAINLAAAIEDATIETVQAAAIAEME